MPEMTAILEAKARRVAELLPPGPARAVPLALILELLIAIAGGMACLKGDPERAAKRCRRPSMFARRRIAKLCRERSPDDADGMLKAVLEMGREVTPEDLAEIPKAPV